MEGHPPMFTVAEILNWPEVEPMDAIISNEDLARTVALYGPFTSEESASAFIKRQRGYGVSNHFSTFRLLSGE